MPIHLSLLSIFRDSASYLLRYFSQVEAAFSLAQGPCHAIWLEGDSCDETFALLSEEKKKLEDLGHRVTLVQHNLKGPYWQSVSHPERWRQLSTCWNHCLSLLSPCRYAVCVESDLIWEPQTLFSCIGNLSPEREVIAPMLMTAKSKELFGKERFYDVWGFSKNGKKFAPFFPYWEKEAEEEQFVRLSSCGGMIVTTHEMLKKAEWGCDDCILQFPAGVKIFMDKTLKIEHPAPPEWEKFSSFQRLLRRCKWR